MKLFLRALSLFVVSVLSIFAADATAATTVSGAINFDQTWTAAGSPYILDGSVSVASGVTLTVQSGVTVQARSSVALTYELLVNGNLVVSGTTGSPVIFTSQGSAANQWKGIRVASTGTINLANTQINNVDSALRIDSGLPATALTVNGLKVERMNSTAVNLGTIASTGTYTLNGLDVTCTAASAHYGVQVASTTPGTAVVNNSRFKDCYYAIYQTATNLTVDHSIFNGGRHGVYFYTSYYGSVSTTVTYSTFYNVGTTSAEGAVVGSRYASTGYNAYVYLSDSLFGASQNVFRDAGSVSYPVSFSGFNRSVVWSTVFSQSASFSTFLRYNALLKDPANGDFTPTERSPARYYFPADPTKTIGAVPYAGDPTGAGLHGFWYTNQIFAPGSVTDASGDVVITAGATLTFQPNSRIRFATTDSMAGGLDTTKAELRVEGTLELDGTNTNKVSVTSAATTPARGDWYGIVIPSNALAFNVGQVDIAYAKRGVSLYANDHAVVGCTIHDSSEYGVYVEGGTPSVEDSNLYSNQVGLFITSPSTPASVDVLNTTVSRSTAQGAYLSNSTLNWIGGEIYDNGNDAIYGYTSYYGTVYLSLDSVTIANNAGDAIDVTRYASTGYNFYASVYDVAITNNAGAAYRDSGSVSYPVTMSCSYSDLWGNTGGNTTYSVTGTCFSYNPLYADITNRDYTPTKYSPLRKLGSAGTFVGYRNWDNSRIGPNLEGFLWEPFTFSAGTTYTILGDIVVPSGSTVTFEAGARLNIAATDDMGGSWSLNGQAPNSTTKVEFHFATGSTQVFPTTGSPVLFTPSGSSPTPGYWEGFRFYDTISKVQKVRLDYANYAFRIFGPRSPVIEDSEARYTNAAGVTATSVTNATYPVDILTTSLIGDGDGYGLSLDNSYARIRSSYITHAAYGIYDYASTYGTTFTLSAVNNTIVHTTYGLYYSNYASTGYNLTVNAWNNVFAVNGSYAIYEGSSVSYPTTETIRYNAFYGVATNYGTFSTNSNNITTDPKVEDDDWATYPRWWDGGLWAESPAINAGSASAPGLPTKDINGRLRTIGTTPDIGAWEFDPTLNREPRADSVQQLVARIVPQGESFILDGSTAYDPDGTIASAYWTVSDGTVLPGLTVTHTISARGAASAYLTIVDNNGAEDHALVNLTVNPRPIADAGPETYSDANGDAALFDGTQSCDPDEGTCPAVGGSTLWTALTFRWNFGDGTAEVTGTGSTFASPRHTYTTGGDYLVTVTVTDNEGLSASDTTIAHVLSPNDVTGPLILHTQLSGGKPVSVAVPVTASITDPSGVSAAVVSYRTIGTTAFSFAIMTNTSGASYTGTIPASAIVAPGVEYWIQAADNSSAQNPSSLPASAPTTLYSFSVTGDLQAPVITHTPIANGQVAGTAVTVSATITDATGVASASLYFKPSGGASFGAVSMSRVSGNLWTAQIPAFIVTSPGVSYYLEATDTSPVAQVGKLPSGAPTTLYTFTVGSGDTTAPTIAHTAIANNQVAGSAVAVTAGVVDAGGVSTVKVWYRTTGTTNTFTAATLSLVSGTTYQGLIPSVGIVAPGVDYYIEATDSSSNVAKEPSAAPASFLTFTVQAVDATGPTIVHTPIANGQTASANVTVTADVTDPSGITTVQLFYRPTGYPFYSSVTMTLTSGSTYTGSIPGFSVTSAGVQYYVRATDTRTNAATLPATAPTTPYAFTVGSGDATAPAITHTRISDGQLAGNAVTIAATITDATGVAGATLFYRTLGAAGFTSTSMSLASGQYTANIPAGSVTTAGVEYYISATDSSTNANLSTLPATAPTATYTFSVISPDATPPAISHTATTTSIYGSAIALTASVTDASGVGSVTLFWAIDAGSFQTTTMAATTGSNFSATIAAGSIPNGTASVRYYIRATDSAGNAATVPAAGAAAPQTITITYPDTIAPSITHAAIASLTFGSALSVSATITDASGVGSATLYYALGAGAFTGSAMSGSGSTYSATVPAGLIPNGTTSIRYYITATDSASNSSTVPVSGSAAPYVISVIYPDVTAPSITHTPVATLVYGSPLSISATITDASGLGSATLYYALGSGSFNSAAMTGSGSTYSATVAAGSIPNGTTSIRYYLSATDASANANVATSPDGGAGSPNVVTVTYPDTAAPVITHSAVTTVTFGAETAFTATVTDATGVGSVTLRWRLDAGSWNATAMSASGSTYTASLAASQVPESASTVQYYIEAVDTAATPNTSVAPATGSSAPYVATVNFPSGHAPVITHTPVAGLTFGNSLTVSATVADASAIGSVTLYWAIGSGAFSARSMTLSGGSYSATIAASEIPSGTSAIRYYIVATDALSYSASLPALGAGAPTSVAVTYLDTTPPTVAVLPITGSVLPGDLLAVSISAVDASAITSVKLFYRTQGTLTFSFVTATGSGPYEAVIPSSAVVEPGLEVYALAIDAAGNAGISDTVAVGVVAPSDLTAPTIAVASPPDGQAASTAVTISATITDDSGIAAASLFYRTAGASSFTAAAFTLISGDTYRATVPAIFVQTPAVEYYVSATDNSPSANQALAPAGAPGTVSRFTVAVSDTAGPSLGHTPLTTAVPDGSSLGLDLTASDASGLGQVRIFWATAGSATYSATTASSLGGGNFYASIGPVRAPSVRYYVEATDSLGNIARLPAAGSAAPFTVSVVVPDNIGPTIVHTPIAGPRNPGEAIVVEATVTDASGVAGLILYYQPTGAGGFSSLTMAAAGGDLWTAIIPSSAVVAPGLSYYIRATDASPAANASNSPAGGLHNFTVNAPVTDTAPPTIGSSLVADGQIAGLPVTVSAAIVDASGVSRATLYFRTAGDTGWLSTAMTATGGTYTAEIPRLVVAAPAVEYYIEAVDGSTAANRGTDPAGAPATSHRFTVVVPDTTGPTISLLPLPLTVEEGTPITVSADVTDTSGIGEVTLFFRTAGASSWFSQRLTLAAGRYEAVLPGSVIAVPGLELYLEATDAVGNLTEEPTTGAADPILVEVTSSAIVDATAPTILHSPASSATYNRALSLSAIVSDASGVRSVTVWYRDLNALDWSFADLTDRGGNRWSGEVPAEALTTSQLSYFIEAFDLSSGSNRAVDPVGAPTEIYTLEVVGLPGDDVTDTGTDATDDTTADTTEDTVADTEADTAPDTAPDTVEDTTADGSGTTVEDTTADTTADTTEDTTADTEEDNTRPRATESGCAAAGARSGISSILFGLAGMLLFAVRAFRSIRAKRAANRLSKATEQPR